MSANKYIPSHRDQKANQRYQNKQTELARRKKEAGDPLAKPGKKK